MVNEMILTLGLVIEAFVELLSVVISRFLVWMLAFHLYAYPSCLPLADPSKTLHLAGKLYNQPLVVAYTLTLFFILFFWQFLWVKGFPIFCVFLSSFHEYLFLYDFLGYRAEVVEITVFLKL